MLVQDVPAAGLLDRVERLPAGAEAPQPNQSPVPVPTGLVRVEHGRVLAIGPDLVVPRLQRVGQAVPHLGQSARADRELEVGVEHVHDLTRGRPDGVMEVSRQGDGPVPEGARGHGVGDDRFDLLLAARAPVAVDRVLGGFRFQVGRDVLDDTRSGAAGPREFAAAVGALGEFVVDPPVDPLGLVTGVPGVPRLAAGLLPPSALRECRVERCERAGRGVGQGLEGDEAGEGEQLESDDGPVLCGERPGLFGREGPGPEGVDEPGSGSVSVAGGAAAGIVP